MTRAFNTLAFMRHHGLGVREGMAFEVVHIYTIATIRNVSQTMKINRDDAKELIHRLRLKDFIEEAPFTRTNGTDHSPPRTEKVWRIRRDIGMEWDMIKTTNILPDWEKRRAAPVSWKGTSI